MDRNRFDEFLKGMARTETVRCGCVDVLKDDEGFLLSLEGEIRGKIRCKYLVGADGASSVVRRKLYISKKFSSYDR